MFAAFSAWLRGIPFAAEVVGDIEEVLDSGVGGNLGRKGKRAAGAVIRVVVKRSSVVRYVTGKTLQERYPADATAITIAYSDVVIDDEDLDWEHERCLNPSPRIVAVGSQEQSYKGHDSLLRAFAIVLRSHPEADLLIIGEGRLQRDLKELAQNLRIEKHVRFQGFLADRAQLRRMVSTGWLFCMPSRTEGMPRSLIEAMAWGLPCVATRVGGIPELLEDEALTRPDDVDGLADAIVRFLSDGEMRADHSGRNRSVAARFHRKEARRAARDWSNAVIHLVSPATAPPPVRPTKVLHLLGALDRGGAELMSLELVRGVPRDELEQHFLCLSGRPGVLAESFSRHGATVHTSDVRNVRFPIDFYRLVRAERPDVVISHVELASGYLLAFSALCGVPRRIARVHNERDAVPGSFSRWTYRLAMRLLLNASAHEIIGVTRASCDYITTGPGATSRLRSKSRVVYNGVDTERFIPRFERRQRVVLHVGRSGPAKNRIRLVRLAPMLAKAGLSTRLVSSDGYRDLEGLDINGLELLDVTDDVPSALQQATVFAFPSLWEGLPGAVLEALSTGTPVVATALPGLGELAQQVDGITLISSGASDEEWVAEIVRVADETSERRARIARSFRRSPFTLTAFVRDWREILLDDGGRND